MAEDLAKMIVKHATPVFAPFPPICMEIVVQVRGLAERASCSAL